MLLIHKCAELTLLIVSSTETVPETINKKLLK